MRAHQKPFYNFIQYYSLSEHYRFVQIILFTLLLTLSVLAQASSHPAITETISTSQLQGYADYPESVKQIITEALKLAGEDLTYTYGSANPKKGGMDCSGIIYYLLRSAGLQGAPRQANTIYKWVWLHGQFYAVNGHHMNSFEFSHLKPGDLLFWSGTYNVHRDPPVTHVMMYLGKNKQGQPLMFGASDGRPYQGKSMWGVSVFDFKLPSAQSKSRFLGYACIPNVNCKSS